MTVVESKAKRPGTVSGGQVTRQETVQVTGAWRAALLASVSALFVVGQMDVAARAVLPPRAKTSRRARTSSPARTPKPAKPIARRLLHRNRRRTCRSGDPFGENMPKGPLQLMVSIGDQRAVLYSNGVRVGETQGLDRHASHPTPTGVFSIIQKNRWHRSNLYGNAPMFYMHRLTWSGIALHEGHLPGYAASHGCIRMPTEFVSRLWNVSKLGMRVVVARSELTPQELHARQAVPAGAEADRQHAEDQRGARRDFVRRLRRRVKA